MKVLHILQTLYNISSFSKYFLDFQDVSKHFSSVLLRIILLFYKIWDVTMESGTALHRIGGPISHVSWSPCDTKIFVATESSLIRYSKPFL